jgi:RNA polymerase sigma factor (sigma-70 family)
MKASAPSSPAPEVVVLRRRVPATTDRLVSIRPPAAEPVPPPPASGLRAVPAPELPARAPARRVVARPIPARAVSARTAPVRTGPAVAPVRATTAEGRALATQANADEALGRLTRLHEHRSELLCLALLEPAASTLLDAIAAELDKGEATIGSIVDEPELGPDEARQRFDALRAGIGRVHREHGHALPFAGVAPLARTAASSAVENALRASRPAAAAVTLQWDSVERLLQASWIARVRARDVSGLPGELVARVRRLDREVASIIDGLVAKHQGLVANVARQYQGLGLSREDLMQDGNLGLLRGIDKFDLRRGKPFGSYAVWWVRQGVRHALATQARTIRLPVQQLANRYALGRASRRLAHTLGREPSEQELAQATGMSAQNISDLLRVSTEPVSLETPRSSESEATIGDVIADTETQSPTEQTSAKESLVELRALLDDLTPRERHVVSLRFGLDGEDERTLEEIGRSLELTRERVRQICAEALDKLNRATRSRGLDL